MAVLKKTMLMGLVLIGLIPLIHACWMMDYGGKAGQCKDPYDNSIHPDGQTWTNNLCLTCTCSPGSMYCCSKFPKSVTPGCTLEKDFKTCNYKVIKNDPAVECKVKF